LSYTIAHVLKKDLIAIVNLI